MTDHYYSNRPTVEHDRKQWTTVIRGQALRFVSDAGVFSKGGVDYGSRVLIDVMEIPREAEVLDVGCGYGPIGLSAARIADQGHITMIDINARAVELCRENAAINGITNVTVMESDLFTAVEHKQYDVVLSNPPIRAGKLVVHAVFEGAYQVLRTGGSLWIVIQKKQGAASARQKLEQLFSNVEEVTKDKGYRIYKATKI